MDFSASLEIKGLLPRTLESDDLAESFSDLFD